MKKFLFCLVMASVALSGCSPKGSGQPAKPRVIVTCDPELDDHNSLIRYLLYSADYDTEGLIYASSQVHWKGDGKGTPQMREGSARRLPGAGRKGNVSSTRMWKPMRRCIPTSSGTIPVILLRLR